MDRAQDALKGRRMSWLINSFLDYLILIPARDLKKYSAKQIYEEIYGMFCSKICQAGVADRVQTDVQHYLSKFIYDETLDGFDEESGTVDGPENEKIKHFGHDFEGVYTTIYEDGKVEKS